jgi:ADP-dependent NAD(P)H-hydrate dehydratase / NAD(P)H-hydrate epimerase
MRVLNATQMREAERVAIEEYGIPSIVLMENAGRHAVDALEAADASALDGPVAVLCGPGNNGGDGFVVARALDERGTDVKVYLLTPREAVSGDARTNLDILTRLEVPIADVLTEEMWARHAPDVAGCALVVDALFGTGLRGPLKGLVEQVVDEVNAFGVPILALDLPSGLSADSARIPGTCIRASMTVTFGAAKLPLVLAPAKEMVGDLVIAQIGLPPAAVDRVSGPRVSLLRPELMRTMIPFRSPDAHKGTCGRVTVIGGGRGKTGAAYLSAMGALRSGAGLVTVATPASNVAILAAMAPEYMTEPLDDGGDGRLSGRALEQVLALRQDVVACGPGLGVSNHVAACVRGLVEGSASPLVLDADALTVLAETPGVLRGRADRPVIITPHPGEMARLIGRSVAEVQADRLEVARAFAVDRGLFVVLKGRGTIVATPDGESFINPTGGAGLATGGTGDVLTGTIAGWLAQGLTPAEACCLGVFLHGRAGDLAEQSDGVRALLASDVLRHLGAALEELVGAVQAHA